jgi:hypothetical protein
VLAFDTQRGTAERHINEGKNAIDWTRLCCHGFRNNEVRLQRHALAYDLGNFLRTLALPEAVEHWSLTTLREKLIKSGAKGVRHGRSIQPIASRSPDRTGVRRPSRGAPSAREMTIGHGFRLPDQPDKGRNPSWHASSRRELWCQRPSCYHRRQLAGAIWEIPAYSERDTDIWRACAVATLRPRDRGFGNRGPT